MILNVLLELEKNFYDVDIYFESLCALSQQNNA